MAKTELESRKMNVADYLQVMEANVHLYPEWATLSDSDKTYTAMHLISFGSAEGLFDGDELVGVQGILQLGIGEAWMAVKPELRERKGALLRASIKNFIRLREIDGYMKIYTGAPLSETFLKHLGFEKEPNAYVWQRKG
jgi:hypothetical protein